MKQIVIGAVIILALSSALTGCGRAKATTTSLAETPAGQEVSIDIINAAGSKTGTARLTPLIHGVQINVEVANLTPGTHGIHFHETGKCEAPKFTTAGSHLNPGGKQHGFNNVNGYHAGDLPNLIIAADGTGKAEFFDPLVTLEKGKPNSLLKEGGTALVIHDKADDMKTDPAGNSGDRIACGVIR